jgi:long-chain fatty acid transport protein
VQASNSEEDVMIKLNKKTPVAVALVGALSIAPGAGFAAGFALLEQNASGLGNAFAGSAAVAQDASTIFFNPAGLTLLPGMQAVVAGSAIYLDTEFSSTAAPVFSPFPGVTPGTNTGGNIGGWSTVPNLYFSMPIGDRFAFGVGINVPFGLTTEYDDDWMGRFQGIKSELTAINVNPSVAFKVSDTVSLGAGINWQKTDVELTNAVFLGPPLPLAPQEGRTKLEADDDAWGWNVGALFQLGSDMRVGVSYRSALDYTLEGDVTTTTLSGAPVALASFPAEAEAKFPDSALLSVTQRFGDKWELLGDLQYTNWSTIDTVDVVNSSNGQTRDQLVLDFNDTWRVAFGVNYFHSERWTFRGGLAWDESPVDDDNRTVRLPDTDRYWLSLGAQYKFGKNNALDFGYTHLFTSDADINRTRAQFGTSLSTTITGEYESSIDVFGIQLTWTF